MGRIEACCQSISPTILQAESGDFDTMMLLCWRSGWRMQKRLRLWSLGTRNDTMSRYRFKFSTWYDGDCCWHL